MRAQQNGFASPLVLLFVAIFVVSVGFMSYRVYKTNIEIDENVATVDSVEESSKESFIFSAAGDFSSSENADLVLRAISESGSNFTLALGDLGYGGNGTEKEWCDFVNLRLESDYPFELVAGNHDDGTRDGDIAEYRKCLPDRLGTTVGDYGVEYYFDYNNLARFIMISPDINNYGYDYLKSTENYDWVASTIDDAREQGIQWVVLGMHKNCITPGVKSCEIGEDILNLAIEKQVDIVLQGHEHGYFRSKQLGFGNDCREIVVNTVNSECITGEGDSLSDKNGTVLVINGAGGFKLRDVNLEDPEIGYFETWNGANIGKSFGYSQFAVSADAIRARFIPVGGGLFTDSFTIDATN